MDEITDRLKLLSQLHYALAVLTALASCGVLGFGGVNYLQFQAMTRQLSQWEGTPLPTLEVAWPMLVLFAAVSVCWGSMTIPIAVAGYFLRRRTQLGFCRLMAVLEMVASPLGLILGLVSLSLLTKPEYKARFSNNK